jgi:glycosyltransferase involved in cell wall biosynthesis
VHRPLPHAPGVVAANRRHYELLVELAGHYAGQGDTEHALRAATLAATYAWLAPVGLLSDTRLERAVVRAVRGSGQVTVDGDRRAGRVLHVLTEAYSTGGHTRLAWRWMDRDERTSDVVLTNQHGPAPDPLVDSVRAKGGELHDLRATATGLLDRARQLRQHMDRADVVVLHVHPYDAVALAAANLSGPRPPVVYDNHADHAYWLGLAGTDLLCDLRPQTRTIDVDLRAVPADRIGVLPLPVDELPSSAGGALRRELGIRPDAVVALTVSADWKMAAAWGRGMHDVVERVLRWSPQLCVVLVGATPNPEWNRLGKRYPGRVFPVGTVPDPAPYFALADVYLDSYPAHSSTSALEAAVLGLPVVALADLPADDPASVFQAGSPGLAGLPRVPTAEKFATAVRRLAADADLRQAAGEEARAAVLAVHDGPAWRAGLEALYEQARALPATDVDALGESPTHDRYAAMVLSAVAPETASPDPRHIARGLGPLFDERMEADLLAVLSRGAQPPFLVRVAPGWGRHEEWTSRLLELCRAHPRLAVSLPFLPGDDLEGTGTEATLITLLAGIGRTAADCGEISVDALRPHHTGPELAGDAQFTDEVLDWLARLMASPLWSPTGTDADGPVDVARGVAVPT